jgi:hypothetical protein
MKLLQLIFTASKAYAQLVNVQLPNFWSEENVDGSVIDILPQSKYILDNNIGKTEKRISATGGFKTCFLVSLRAAEKTVIQC